MSIELIRVSKLGVSIRSGENQNLGLICLVLEIRVSCFYTIYCRIFDYAIHIRSELRHFLRDFFFDVHCLGFHRKLKAKKRKSCI